MCGCIVHGLMRVYEADATKGVTPPPLDNECAIMDPRRVPGRPWNHPHPLQTRELRNRHDIAMLKAVLTNERARLQQELHDLEDDDADYL